MKLWLERLSQREKIMLLGGAAVLLLAGLYTFIYSPLEQENKRLKLAIQDQQQLREFLQTISAEVAALRQAASENSTIESSASPMSIIDTSSQQMGVKAAIKKLAPESQERVGLWLEKCAFDALTGWLVVLDQKHGIKVKQIDISRENTGIGLVRGKIVLGK